MRRIGVAAGVLAAVALATFLVVRTCGGGEVMYYAAFYKDAKVGYMRVVRRVKGDRVIHDESLAIAVRYAGRDVSIEVNDRYVETLAGEPLEFTSVMEIGGPVGKVVRRGRIEHGQLHATIEERGQTREVTRPWPAGALFPEGQRLRYLAQGRGVGSTYSMAILDKDNLEAMAADVTVGPTGPVMLIGRLVRGTRVTCQYQSRLGPMTTVDYVDDAGATLRGSVPFLDEINLYLVACDEAYATGSDVAVDLRDGPVVASPCPLPDALSSTRATFTLAPADGASLVLPVTGEQEVEIRSDGTTVVRVALQRPADTCPPYSGDDPSLRAMLTADPYIQSDHVAIANEVRTIVGEAPDAGQAPRRIEAWVRDQFPDTSLGSGYFPSVVALGRGKGDCTEQAVLTAALCRAAGIPCRVVVGLVYVESYQDRENCFISHAWNQAYVDGKWTCLDATVGAHAARIALTFSDGDPMDFIGLIETARHVTIAAAEVE